MQLVGAAGIESAFLFLMFRNHNIFLRANSPDSIWIVDPHSQNLPYLAQGIGFKRRAFQKVGGIGNKVLI